VCITTNQPDIKSNYSHPKPNSATKQVAIVKYI